MKIENPEYTESERFPNLVLCKNCYVQFDLTRSVTFTQKNIHCEKHEFMIPHGAEIYKIDDPCYFIRWANPIEVEE